MTESKADPPGRAKRRGDGVPGQTPSNSTIVAASGEKGLPLRLQETPPLTYGSPANFSIPPCLLEQAEEVRQGPKPTRAKTTEIAASPMERYWIEPQRHERIAVMMAGKGSDPAGPMPPSAFPSTLVRQTKRRLSKSDNRNLNDVAVPQGAQGANDHAERSPSPSFCPGLVVDLGAGDVTDEPDLETIRIAARIKSVVYTPELSRHVH